MAIPCFLQPVTPWRLILLEIAYNPNDADSIISAVLSALSLPPSLPYTFKKSSGDKSKALATFEDLAKKASSKSKDFPDKEQLRNKRNGFFTKKKPYFLAFITNSGKQKKSNPEATKAVRLYVEKNYGDLSVNPLAFGSLLTLLDIKTEEELKGVADAGYVYLNETVPVSQYLALEKDLKARDKKVVELSRDVSAYLKENENLRMVINKANSEIDDRDKTIRELLAATKSKKKKAK